MSENTKIEWCDHTFNPWIGCTKVGPGCDNCYAEADFDKRRHVVRWGAGQPRKRTSEANWAKPLTWNRNHDKFFFKQHGRRQRVFCSSLADVFDNEVDPQWRVDLFRLIAETPNLDWLLLTKRIGNARSMSQLAMGRIGCIHKELPPNVWIGATIVNQEEADRDIQKLLATPARVRFLSMEPLLGPVRLTRLPLGGGWYDCLGGWRNVRERFPGFDEQIDWVIVGGESGRNARPMHPDWARSLRDQCAAAGVPFLFKQWGEWMPIDAWEPWDRTHQVALRLDGSGMPDEEWHDDGARLKKVGKKAAGRLLDGRTWDEFPRVVA